MANKEKIFKLRYILKNLELKKNCYVIISHNRYFLKFFISKIKCIINDTFVKNLLIEK